MVRYAELLELLETDDRALVHAAMPRATRELRSHHHRDVAVERGQGYRVLFANQHVGKAEDHKDRAERQIQLASDVVDATNLAELTAMEREQWSQVRRGMTLLLMAVSTHEVALARHEDLINSLQQRVEELETGQDGHPPAARRV